jgi:hypothetical protein
VSRDRGLVGATFNHLRISGEPAPMIDRTAWNRTSASIQESRVTTKSAFSVFL